MTNTTLQLRDDLLRLGVRAGGVLLVHGSLSALGHVHGGAETVIDGVLAALGEGGTLLMPALSYERVTPEHPFFDVRATPSNVGVIAETFRLRPGMLRSVHPTHSVCAVGPLAAQILDPHAEDSTPCGPRSPFHTLPKYNGQILMLGCGLAPNTSMHAVEELVVPPYLYDPPIEYQITSDAIKLYTPHNFRGFRQRYDRIAQMLTSPALRRGPVLAGEAFLLDAAAMWNTALAALRGDPLAFVEPSI